MAKRALATSVVMTFSLAASGCTEAGRTMNPPPPAKPEPPRPEPPAGNPPPPEIEPPPPQVTYEAREDGTCWEYVAPSCPPNVPCNPPPPKQVECKDDMLPEAADPKRVAVREDESCWEEPQVDCEPGESCNPPPPMRVRCPSDDDAAQAAPDKP